MLEKVLRFFITLIFAILGGALMQLASPLLTLFLSTEVLKLDLGLFGLTLASLVCILVGAVLGGVLGFITTPLFTATLKRFTYWVETQLNKMPIHDVIAGAAGLAIGLIIANLLGAAFSNIPLVGAYFPVVFSIVSAFISRSRSARKSAIFSARCRI